MPGSAPTFFPHIGMSYREFETLATRSQVGRPIAITSHNNVMIYTIAYHTEEYYWFENGYFTKVTTRYPDDDKAWKHHTKELIKPCCGLDGSEKPLFNASPSLENLPNFPTLPPISQWGR
jgi:hypothetical protein